MLISYFHCHTRTKFLCCLAGDWRANDQAGIESICWPLIERDSRPAHTYAVQCGTSGCGHKKFRSESWIEENNCQTIVSVIWEHPNIVCKSDAAGQFYSLGTILFHWTATHHIDSDAFASCHLKYIIKKSAMRRAASHCIGVSWPSLYKWLDLSFK